MRLPAEFMQLPLRFDAARLSREIDSVPAEAWLPHPQGFAGNDALVLVSVGGNLTSNEMAGEMKPTAALAQCPYLQQVMAAFETVIGRSRLMRIAGASEASPHYDLNYYWHQRMRIHVPIQTHPDVRFHCGERSVHMEPGDCWVFDTWKIHRVNNPSDHPRVHLVCDTVGSGAFWDLLARARNPFADTRGFSPQSVDWKPETRTALQFETTNSPEVMTPWEQESLLATVLDDLAGANPPLEVFRQFQARLERFRFQWRGLWARFGLDPAGRPAYRQALSVLERQMEDLRGQMELPNAADPVEVVIKVLVLQGLSDDPVRLPATPEPVPDLQSKRGPDAGSRTGSQPPSQPRLRRPIIIAAAPRSGSTLLFETLSRSPDLVSIGGESHGLIERIEGLHPSDQNYDSNALTAADARPERIDALRQNFLDAVLDHEPAERIQRLGPDLRLLEKTPKNALRLDFLLEAFPAARIVHLVRDPHENIASIIEAWQSGRFVTYPGLPGWQGPPWSLLLIPGWRDLPADDLAMVAASQWQAAHDAILDSIEALDGERVRTVHYEDLRADPAPVIAELCDFLEIAPPPAVSELPLSRHTLTPPDPDKWRRHARDLDRVLPAFQATRDRLEARSARPAAG